VPPIPLGDATLDVALRYFGAHGLRSSALDDVARSADLDLQELRQRYPTSRSLVIGIFERMLDILSEQLEEQSKRGASLGERLQRWFELELQLLEPCKALVRGWLLDSINPLSPAAWLQGPLAFRYGALLQREFELARQQGEISGWVWPSAAAAAFVSLRRSLISVWLGDESGEAARTLPFARAEIAAFVRLLAPWPGLDEPRPASAPREPRALPIPIQPARAVHRALPLPVASASLLEEPAAAAVQPAVVPADAVPPAAVDAAIAQAPAVLGTLAQPELAPEALVDLEQDDEAPPSDPARLDQSSPAPAQPGGDKAAARAKRRSRAKRSKH
jgi:AcrR family transcriptional regulator